MHAFERAVTAAFGQDTDEIDDPIRSRDGARHPYETLRFFGLAPTQTVIEIAPGTGWYTEILAPYLNDTGRLYAAHFAADAPEEGRRRARARFEAKLAQDPSNYGGVILGTLPRDGRGFTDIAPPGGADLVLTFRNVHNWITAGTVEAVFSGMYRALKPGGVLGIVEHRGTAQQPQDPKARSGYVSEATAMRLIESAGFRLIATSEINANPRDTKDHPRGVWNLPPTLIDGDKDRARYVAIGETDRFTFKFIKPR
jgi:predicted methyltransferase